MSLESLIATSTKIWLDGAEPNAIAKNGDWGITSASRPTASSWVAAARLTQRAVRRRTGPRSSEPRNPELSIRRRKSCHTTIT